MPLGFDCVRRAIRAIPNSAPGKQRLARLALMPFRAARPIAIPDRYGNVVWSPSVNEPIATALFASGVYEQGTVDFILSALPESGVYVDVGANVGAIALPVAAQRPLCTVVCVEGDPAIAHFLKRNVRENQRGNVFVDECLAGPAFDPGVPFYRAPDDKFGMGSIGPQFGDDTVALVQRALDDVLDGLGIADVDVVKLDIEGAELGALRGLERRLASGNAPTIVLEFADWAESRIAAQRPGDAQRFLLDCGYRLYELRQGRGTSRELEQPLTSGAAMLVALPPCRRLAGYG